MKKMAVGFGLLIAGVLGCVTQNDCADLLVGRWRVEGVRPGDDTSGILEIDERYIMIEEEGAVTDKSEYRLDGNLLTIRNEEGDLRFRIEFKDSDNIVVYLHVEVATLRGGKAAEPDDFMKEWVEDVNNNPVLTARRLR